MNDPATAPSRSETLPRSVCVFCGSATGADPVFAAAASAFGRFLAESGVRLVYGGGKVGLMGAVASAALEVGGNVVGVMPRGLVEREIAHEGLSELRVVDTMHERKTAMSELSDAFAVLPGGAGTLEEAFEQWTWAQLAIHQKPVGFLNIAVPALDGAYFDPLLAMIARMTDCGFLDPRYRDMLVVTHDPATMIEAFAAYVAPTRKSYEPSATSASGSVKP